MFQPVGKTDRLITFFSEGFFLLFIGSCILCTTDFKPILPNGVPLLAVAGIVFSIALAIFSIKKLK